MQGGSRQLCRQRIAAGEYRIMASLGAIAYLQCPEADVIQRFIVCSSSGSVRAVSSEMQHHAQACLILLHRKTLLRP